MRNQVRHLTRFTLTAACLLPVTALLTAGVAAAADTDPNVESRVPVTLDGFALLAILVGFGGLIAGLLRHRHRLAREAKAAAQAAKAVVEESAAAAAATKPAPLPTPSQL
ncbi:hypothetical protein [Kutzneria sp. CA-103260]|uniref:hypothetical protein n=1 Tax=Kutzneria sp. CA-103260 TaxID=2802641 RepID=UPI001BABDCD3|nr:hypothetical protein [Kutzneria sp. CA-103260]QUQ70797.1 hypothetical protein JJ691_85800 [Kutzneria sp. CA-103260]